jgi:DNA-binding CsgD family transcriptional regulator
MGAELLQALEHATDVVQGARNQPRQLDRLFNRSPVPLVMMDNRRRFRHANAAACMALRLGLGDLLARRAPDVVLPFAMPTFEGAWTEMCDAGHVAVEALGLEGGDRAPVTVAAHGVAEAMPGLFLAGFAPGCLSGDELAIFPDGSQSATPLTPRELELLQLAADGVCGPMIAEELVLSRATVRTHFENIYGKLGVHDRAGAVGKAMRLGLIS